MNTISTELLIDQTIFVSLAEVSHLLAKHRSVEVLLSGVFEIEYQNGSGQDERTQRPVSLYTGRLSTNRQDPVSLWHFFYWGLAHCLCCGSTGPLMYYPIAPRLNS